MNKQETIADTIAEMRIFKCRNLETGELESCNAIANYFADRLEAARKRMEWTHKKELETKDAVIQTEVAAREAEREAHKRELDEIKKQVGNAAKLREAVKAVVDVGCPHNFQREAPHIRGYCYDITRAIEKCFASLAAPVRNCDVGMVKEQSARFRKFCKKGSMDSLAATAYCAYECPCGNSYDCKLAWAQMPYSEGGNNELV